MKTMKKKRKDEVFSAANEDAIRNFVNDQKQYKKIVISRMYKGCELKEIRSQLENDDIKMQWYGMKFPKDLLALEHDMVQSNYYDLILDEERMKKSLIARGVTKEQLKALLEDGKFVKEIPEIKKEERSDYIG